MKLGFWLLAIGLWLLAFPFVYAQGFGVSPAEITDDGTINIVNTGPQKTLHIKATEGIMVSRTSLAVKNRAKINVTAQKAGRIEIYEDGTEINAGLIVNVKITEHEIAFISEKTTLNDNVREAMIFSAILLTILIFTYYSRIKQIALKTKQILSAKPNTDQKYSHKKQNKPKRQIN